MRARVLGLIWIASVACGRTTSPPVAGDGGGAAGSEAGSDADLTCTEQITDTTNAVDSAVTQVLADPADVSCTKDSDCAVASIDSDCWSGCEGPVLNQTGTVQLASDVAAINAATCASFTADGCQPPPPLPCPPLAGVPSCVSGVCSAGKGFALPCVLDGGTWVCPGVGTYPACPTGADGPTGYPSMCQYDGGCFGCIYQGSAGATCWCGGEGGTEWECLGANLGCSQ